MQDDHSKKSGTQAPAPRPQLEAPPESDHSPDSQASLLFDSESVAVLASRLNTAEALIGLLVRDVSHHEFMQEVLLSFLRAIKCEAGSLLEVDRPTGALFFRAIAGQSSDKLAGVRIPRGAGIVGHVAESRRPILVEDTSTDERYLKVVSAAVGFPARNLMAAPIVIRNEVFAVVEVFNRLGKPYFDRADLDLLERISDMAANVIEARLMLNRLARQGRAA